MLFIGEMNKFTDSAKFDFGFYAVFAISELVKLKLLSLKELTALYYYALNEASFLKV